MTAPGVHERPAGETPRPHATPAERRPRREPTWSLGWLPFGILLGVALMVPVHLALRPVLEDWAVRAAGMGTMFLAAFVDWRRWREIQWRPFAVWAVFVYALAFAVWYLFPD